MHPLELNPYFVNERYGEVGGYMRRWVNNLNWCSYLFSFQYSNQMPVDSTRSIAWFREAPLLNQSIHLLFHSCLKPKYSTLLLFDLFAVGTSNQPMYFTRITRNQKNGVKFGPQS